jgi:hypothetical protein
MRREPAAAQRSMQPDGASLLAMLEDGQLERAAIRRPAPRGLGGREPLARRGGLALAPRSVVHRGDLFQNGLVQGLSSHIFGGTRLWAPGGRT